MKNLETNIQPEFGLTLTSLDTVAECYEGISTELYSKLWSLLGECKPMSEQINIEESSPCDAIGLNNVASFWERFSDIEKEALNAAERQNAEMWA